MSISGVVTVVETHTDAHIGHDAKVNCGLTCATNVGGANGAQDVRVASANQFYQLGITASLAIGGDAGVAVPVSVRLVKLNSDAWVDHDTTINAKRNITITSNGRDTAVTVVAGAGGGLVGVAGSVSVTILNTHTYAQTNAHVSLHAGGNVLIGASEPSKITLVVASIAGGFVGVGAAVGVLSGTKDTRAVVGTNNTITADACCTAFTNQMYNGQVFDNGTFGTLPSFSGVAVQATSSEDIFGITVSAAGGFVGVAVGVGVTLMDATTEALVGDGVSITTGGGVNVSAVDYAKTLTVGGGAAGGFVGVGGGVDIGVLNVTVLAQVGTGTINAAGDVDVNALSRKNVRTIAISLGGGFVGAAGSVAVWTVGTVAATTYDDQGNTKQPLNPGGGNASSEADNTATSTPDAWVSGTAYKKGDIVRDNGQNFAAQVDITGGSQSIAPHSNPDWAVTNKGGYGSALDGTSGTSGSDTAGVMSGHINTTETKSNNGISGATPTTAPTNAALTNAATAKGTKAVLNASVTTGGGVHVRAIDRTEFNGLAGTAAGGLVGLGISVLVMSLQTSTEAQIGAGTIDAGGTVLVQASQDNEQVHGLAFTGAAGAAAIEGEVVVINDSRARTRTSTPACRSSAQVAAWSLRRMPTGMGCADVGVGIGARPAASRSR